MPRKPRVQFPGANYQVMSRGDRGENIFLDDVDHQPFLKTLAEPCQKTGFEVHESDPAKWRMALRLRAETTLARSRNG